MVVRAYLEELTCCLSEATQDVLTIPKGSERPRVVFFRPSTRALVYEEPPDLLLGYGLTTLEINKC